jgi:hypothetical protein
MANDYTEADKSKLLSALSDIIKEDKDKYHVYHDIYHVLKNSCDCRVPEDKILPEKAHLLRFLQKKIHDHECHGLIHERLIKVVENLPTVDEIPPSGSHFYRFFTESEHYHEFLHGNSSVLGAEMLPIIKESTSKKRSREEKADNEERKKAPNQEKGEKDN